MRKHKMEIVNLLQKASASETSETEEAEVRVS